MPSSQEYQDMYALLEQKFKFPPLETLHIAILIDMLAILEKMERKRDGTTYTTRKYQRRK